MKTLKTRQTKIVATIGPATKTEEKIKALIAEGIDIARFNFSHGAHAEYTRWTKIIHQWSKRLGRHVAILGDLQGPRFRIGNLPQKGRHLIPGHKLTVWFEEKSPLGRNEITVLVGEGDDVDLKRGDTILLDNGSIELEVLSDEGTRTECKIITGGHIIAHKGVNLPSAKLDNTFTEKDDDDLNYILEHKLDWVGLSFVSTEKDVMSIKKRIAGRAKIVAKIERQAALDNLGEIIKNVDMVMVARGDLGIETPLARLPLVQKKIIHECNRAGKPVITATQMLASMAFQPKPTRAEVSDVANAILDGANAVMLSEETAMGQYPIETVRMMRTIIEETEAFIKHSGR
jgi:pyruvate kinase